MSLFIWFVLAAFGQTPEEKTLAAARSVMQSARYCFLITMDETGQPQSRLMEPFAPDDEMRVWLGTNPATRKVRQIRKNARATLSYYSASPGPDYVTLTGRARIVEDRAQRRKRWRAEWEAFFPGGPEGSNYTLIEFVPSRIEVISNAHGIGTTPASLRPPILERKGSKWIVR